MVAVSKGEDEEFDAVTSITEQVHRLAAARGTSRALLLLDSRPRCALDDKNLKALIESGKLDVTTVHLLHPSLDPSWQPKLLALDLTRFCDTEILRIAVEMWREDSSLNKLQTGQGDRICALLLTPQDSAAVATHLSRVAIQKRPGEASYLLRLYDPMVFDQLWAACSPAQRASLLGPISCWILRDRFGRAVGFDNPISNQSEPLTFDPSQWQAFETIEAVNQAWIRARVQQVEVDARGFQAAATATDRARAQGVASGPDLDLFAWHALSVHPEFGRHPRIRSILDKVSAHLGYSALADGLSEGDWREITNEMTQLGPARESYQ